jgi:hypothetical protein
MEFILPKKRNLLSLEGEGYPALAREGFRRGRVRGTAVGERAGVTTATNRHHSPSPTATKAELRSAKSSLPSPPCGGEVFLRDNWALYA